ncbi:MAG: YaiI/YqxD family protein [Planctomycetes bacterium]|nr:YaiI/YqxD family protein [Planctomycetota bacterium]
MSGAGAPPSGGPDTSPPTGPVPLTIWIDADAAPREVKEIVFRAGKRLALRVTLVANSVVQVPAAYAFVESVGVPPRADAADHWIAAHAQPGDVVISADVELAARVVERGAACIDPRGQELTADDARTALSVRNAMEQLRGAGVNTGGPRPFSPRDAQAFAAALDRVLRKFMRGRGGDGRGPRQGAA